MGKTVSDLLKKPTATPEALIDALVGQKENEVQAKVQGDKARAEKEINDKKQEVIEERKRNMLDAKKESDEQKKKFDQLKQKADAAEAKAKINA